MKYLEITPGLSINPNTGEHWRKVDVRVAVEEGENPDDVFKTVMARIDGWLPNPFAQIKVDYSAIPGHPMNVSEPPNTNNKELGAMDREKTIDAYYQIINMKGASAKYLEKQRQHIEALNDEALTIAFNNKLKELQ